MNVYFADRKLNIIGMANTSTTKGLKIEDDSMEEDVDTGTKVLNLTIPYTMEQRREVEKMTDCGNYILLSQNGLYTYMTIITRDNERNALGGEIDLYCEDAGMDLLNEIVPPYEADKAYPISYYIEKFSYDSGFKIGINEISNLKRTLKWEGSETATARLQSIATEFDNAEISFSFDIKNLTVVNKYINIFKKRGETNDVELHLGDDIDTITIKESVEELGTYIKVTGGTPEDSDVPITLSGVKYDDGDIHVVGGDLCSRSALQKWSRYNSEKGGNDVGHIVRQYSYDTLNKDELLTRAINNLKQIMVPQINYEVDVVNPKDVKIGDTVRLIDVNGELYLSSRVLKIKTSETKGVKQITLGDYLIQEGGISKDVMMLAQQFKEIASKREFYTWTAYADSNTGDGISLDPNGKKYMGIATNQETKIADLSNPSKYKWSLIRGYDSYLGTISTTNGTVLKHAEDSTTLTANVWVGRDNVTNDYTISWYKDGEKLTDARSLLIRDKNMTSDTEVYKFEAYNALNQKVVSAEITIIKIRDGQNGKDGNSITIKNTTVTYQVSLSGVSVPSGEWSESTPTVPQGQYLWTKTFVEYSDGTVTVSYSVSRNGVNGTNGTNGKDGQNGKGVSSIIVQYYVSSSKVSPTGGQWSTQTPQWTSGKYLWLRYRIEYVNPSSVEFTTPMCDSTWEAVNRIQVGGVNLINGTSTKERVLGGYPSSGETEGVNYVANSILLKDSYVVSFDAKSTHPGDVIVCKLYNPNNITYVETSQGYTNSARNDGYAEITLSDKYERYWIKYTQQPNTDTKPKTCMIGTRVSGRGSGTVSIKETVKLEAGTKNTDYTASPSDLVTVINSNTAPTNTDVLWCDTSESPYQLKKYDKATSKWTIVNDYTNDLSSLRESITESYSHSIDMLRDSLTSLVQQLTTTVSDNGSAIESLTSQLIQNASSITAMTTSINTITNNITGMVSKQEISQWARFENGVLTLGESNSPFSVKLGTSELGFYQNGTKIAYLSNQQLHISQAVILSKINLGIFNLSYDSKNGFSIL